MNQTNSEIQNPPTGFFSSLRYLGPGLILSAAIVGSGELIATTALGAKAGYALLWVILLGCLVKVAVQLEYGRYCISHGLPSFQAWNKVGRFKIFKVHWSVYCGVLFMLTNFAGQGGVLGGAAQSAAFMFPSISTEAWSMMIVIAIGLMVFHGKYGPIEKIATLFNVLFASAILYCVYAIQSTDYAFSLSNLASGLTFHLPSDALVFALTAFGITGVASGEITTYPYWCIEKGYAAWTGPNDGSSEWALRARGWIRVMTFDALVSMVIYTITTCAFYILGAAILSTQATLADGNELILQLSNLFTEALGEGTRNVFMICAFTVLFSTIFSNTAGFSRLWTDAFGLFRIIDWNNSKQRIRSIAVMAWVFPLISGTIYLLIQKPLFLVVLMGISNTVYLLVVAYQALVFRYRGAIEALRPSLFYDAILWISVASIGYMAARSAYQLFN
jgi:manganese transport protein